MALKRLFFVVMVGLLAAGSTLALQTQATLRLIAEPNSLTVVSPSDQIIELAGLEFRALDAQNNVITFQLIHDFDILLLTNAMVEANSCFVYVLSGATPPLPSACSNPNRVYRREVQRADVFWYDFTENRQRDIAIFRDGNFLQTCPGASSSCNITWQIIPTPTPRPTDIPTATPTPPEIAATDDTPAISSIGNVQEITYLAYPSFAIIGADGTQERTFNLCQMINRGSCYALSDLPDWAPDGHRAVFAFASDTPEVAGMYVMDVDRISLNRVSAEGSQPQWLDNGEKIAYWAKRSDTHYDLVFITPEGLGLGATGVEASEPPVLSPDGRTIAYVTLSEGYPVIYLMDSDGTDVRSLTAPRDTNYLNPDRYYNLEWSPNGVYLAYMFKAGNNSAPVFNVADTVALEIQTLLNYQFQLPESNLPLSWSPDSTQIAFHYDLEGNNQIYMVDVKTQLVTRLTNDPASDRFPVWSPDGNRIAFISDRNGTDEIFIMDKDGNNVWRVPIKNLWLNSNALSPIGWRLLPSNDS